MTALIKILIKTSPIFQLNGVLIKSLLQNIFTPSNPNIFGYDKKLA